MGLNETFTIIGTYNVNPAAGADNQDPMSNRFRIHIAPNIVAPDEKDGQTIIFETERTAEEYASNELLYSQIDDMQHQLIADITGKTLAEVQLTYQQGETGQETRTQWIEDAQDNGSSYSPTDFAQIMLNARKFNPETIAEGGSAVNRVDTALYASTEIDSEQYIGPMDGLFTSGDTTFSYASDNPNPYKFSIDITAAPDGTSVDDPAYQTMNLLK